MKLNLITAVLFSLLSFISFSQVPQAMNYQAVVRDGNGQILSNQNVGIRFIVKQGSSSGTTVYTETFDTTSNVYGLINLKIGTGTTVDNFSSINWPTGPYFLETSMDMNGGTNYAVLGTSEFITVPYVFHAETAENVINDNVDDADADPTNELNTAFVLSGNILTISDAGGNIDVDLSGIDTQLTEAQVDAYIANNGYITSPNDADSDSTNELISAFTLAGNILTISDAGGSIDVDLSGIDTDTQLTEAQVDAYVANNGYITSPNDADSDSTNELNTAFTLAGNILTISDAGGSIDVDLSGIDTDTQLTEAQVDAYVANNGYITSPNDADSDPSNEIQTLSINGNTLSLSNNGGSVPLPTGNNNSIWSQNGSSAYYNSGNVGIGTGIPDYLLDVDGDMGIDRYIYHNDDPNEDTYLGFSSNDNFDVWVGGHNPIDVGTGFGGTGSTNLKSQSISLPNIPSSSLSGTDRVLVSNSSGFLKTVPSSSFGGGGSGINGSGSTNRLTFWQNNSTVSYAPYLYYNPSTNRLGIGSNNTNPLYDLDVDGDISMDERLAHNGDSDTYLEFSNNRAKLYAGNNYFFDYRTMGGSNIAWMNADKFIFQKNESSFQNTSLEPIADGSGFIGGAARWNTGYFVGMDLTTAPNISSDARLKHNITPIPEATNILMELNPVSYDLVKDRKTRDGEELEPLIFEDQVGLIAQELDEVLPHLVKKPDAISEYYGVNYTGLIPYLIKAMQEQQAEIELLKTELQQLKASDK